jgi:GxxExxY protein
MVKEDYPLSKLFEKKIRCSVSSTQSIRSRFPRKVYENALKEELQITGSGVDQQKPLTVLYGGKPVGDFIADLLVEKSLIVERKANKTLDRSHENQLLNYRKSSGIEVGLIINFGDIFI